MKKEPKLRGWSAGEGGKPNYRAPPIRAKVVNFKSPG